MNASILVADDEPNIVLSLEFLLKQAGFRVRTVSDGEAALAAIAQEPPDLVLLDVMIPGRDGFAVCQEIRGNPAWRNTRIMMLTAKGGDVQREKGLSLGADEYVTKPFSMLLNRLGRDWPKAGLAVGVNLHRIKRFKAYGLLDHLVGEDFLVMRKWWSEKTHPAETAWDQLWIGLGASQIAPAFFSD